jgi:hypothetical protein
MRSAVLCRVLVFAPAFLAPVGCESLSNFDITYAPRNDGGAGDAEAGVDLDAMADALPSLDGGNPTRPPDASDCPCSLALSEGCCILANVTPFCTSAASACTAANGIAIFCTGYDMSSQSECCWNGPPGPSSAAQYATSCGSRPTACAQPTDCTGSQGCETVSCSGVVIGACGLRPVCP